MKTLKQLANDALAVQDACNLSGVVHSFSRAMSDLRDVVPGEGTAFYNRHPVAVLYANKIADMTGCESLANFSAAFDACMALRDS